MILPDLRKILNAFRSVTALWRMCIIVNIITFLWIYIKIRPGNETLALHYNVLVGVELFGKGKNLYLIPGIAMIITAINYTLYRFIRSNKNFLPSLTILASLVVQLVLLLSAILLTQVN